jgi:hypothetical protein
VVAAGPGVSNNNSKKKFVRRDRLQLKTVTLFTTGRVFTNFQHFRKFALVFCHSWGLLSFARFLWLWSRLCAIRNSSRETTTTTTTATTTSFNDNGNSNNNSYCSCDGG